MKKNLLIFGTLLLVLTAFGCKYASDAPAYEESERYELVLMEGSAAYQTGGTYRFPQALHVATSVLELTANFTLKNTGNTRINLTGVPKSEFTYQSIYVLWPTNYPYVDTANDTFEISAQISADFLDPGDTADFVVRYFFPEDVSGYPLTIGGEASATMVIETQDDAANQVDFVFNMYGIISC